MEIEPSRVCSISMRVWKMMLWRLLADIRFTVTCRCRPENRFRLLLVLNLLADQCRQ